jgi:hypothetical protein
MEGGLPSRQEAPPRRQVASVLIAEALIHRRLLDGDALAGQLECARGRYHPRHSQQPRRRPHEQRDSDGVRQVGGAAGVDEPAVWAFDDQLVPPLRAERECEVAAERCGAPHAQSESPAANPPHRPFEGRQRRGAIEGEVRQRGDEQEQPSGRALGEEVAHPTSLRGGVTALDGGFGQRRRGLPADGGDGEEGQRHRQPDGVDRKRHAVAIRL